MGNSGATVTTRYGTSGVKEQLLHLLSQLSLAGQHYLTYRVMKAAVITAQRQQRSSGPGSGRAPALLLHTDSNFFTIASTV